MSRATDGWRRVALLAVGALIATASPAWSQAPDPAPAEDAPGEPADDEPAEQGPAEQVPDGDGPAEDAPAEPAADEPAADEPAEPEPAPAALPTPPVMSPRPYLHTARPERALLGHRLSVDHETPMSLAPISLALFADVATDVQFAGTTLGVYRAFELHLGYARAVERHQDAMGETITTSRTGFGYGVSALFVSWNGLELNGGFYGVGWSSSRIRPLARLQVPLDARWMPLRIPRMRVRVNYPWGVGIEWTL